MNDFISPHRNQAQRHGAFSLLEVAFALVIFVIGALALLRIFPGGLSVLEDSGNRRVASQMSQNLLTSYNSGDLSSTTPEGIYDADLSGAWNDYPLSAVGLRRQVGTVPLGPDDLTSAKDALRYVHGERQGIFNNSVYLNNIANRQVQFYREGSVSGVTIHSSGQLDFRKARYLVSNRADLDAKAVKADFREPYLDEPEGAPVSDGVITLQRGDVQLTYTIVWPFRTANGVGTITDVTPGTLASAGDVTVSAITSTGTAYTCTVTVPANATQSNLYMPVTFTPSNTAGVSRLQFVCKVIGPQGDTATTPVSATALLPIRPPVAQRGNDCIYYLSSTWSNGTGGAFDQPMIIPTTYDQGVTTAGTVPSITGYTSADSPLLAPLRFRQSLGSNNSTREGMPVAVPTTTVTDVDGQLSTTNLTKVSLDYEVRDWEYISEDISQFGTPFPGDGSTINTTTAEGLSQFQFQFSNPVQGTPPTPTTRGNLREIRTRLGNLRGPVQIKGLYAQSAQAMDVTFNPRTAPQGAAGLTADQQRAYSQQANTLAKQGRLYLPATNDGGAALSRARVYYRSRDAWAQQVGVTAPHYIPYALVFNRPAEERENWREYVKGNDGYIYFHASEAGKTVECVYGTSIGSTATQTLEISPDVLFVSTLPGGVPAAFANTAFNKPGDPRNGQFYLARSRDTVRPAATTNIFDIRRPSGTSGISVRTLWLNNDRYAQEVAQ
ncbi:hypothetical protein EON83_28690 [bacterium]|nr:MAG: hypothetical protein EON83_28690 [bacterium]